MQLLILIATFITIAFAQQRPPTPPPCNPYLQVCPNPNCTDSADLGQTYISSPNITSYFYLGKSINITWYYSPNTNPTYPINGVALYYHLLQDVKWQQIAFVNGKNTTYIWDISSLPLNPGVYEVRVVPDNVDRNGLTGVRNSCYGDGFPMPLAQKFRILTIANIPRPTYSDKSKDPNEPNMSNAFQYKSFLIVLMMILFIFFLI